MNFVNIAGHLGADPEVRFTSSGKKVTTLRVAAHARKGTSDETIWWRVTIWGEQYDKMVSYLKKGSPVIVFGDLQKPEIFTDRDGKPQISLNIIAVHLQFSPFGRLDRAQEGTEANGASTATSSFGTNSRPFPTGAEMGLGPDVGMGAPMSMGKSSLEDDVPF